MNTNNILYEIFQNPNYLLNGNEIIFYFSSSYINNINIMEWRTPLPKTGNHLWRCSN